MAQTGPNGRRVRGRWGVVLQACWLHFLFGKLRSGHTLTHLGHCSCCLPAPGKPQQPTLQPAPSAARGEDSLGSPYTRHNLSGHQQPASICPPLCMRMTRAFCSLSPHHDIQVHVNAAHIAQYHRGAHTHTHMPTWAHTCTHTHTHTRTHTQKCAELTQCLTAVQVYGGPVRPHVLCQTDAPSALSPVAPLPLPCQGPPSNPSLSPALVAPQRHCPLSVGSLGFSSAPSSKTKVEPSPKTKEALQPLGPISVFTFSAKLVPPPHASSSSLALTPLWSACPPTHRNGSFLSPQLSHVLEFDSYPRSTCSWIQLEARHTRCPVDSQTGTSSPDLRLHPCWLYQGTSHLSQLPPQASHQPSIPDCLWRSFFCDLRVS